MTKAKKETYAAEVSSTHVVDPTPAHPSSTHNMNIYLDLLAYVIHSL